MVSTNDVYRKIKEISKRYANPRPQVTIELIAQELRSTRDQITSSLTELKYLRLIQYENYTAVHVKLTLLGYTVNR